MQGPLEGSNVWVSCSTSQSVWVFLPVLCTVFLPVLCTVLRRWISNLLRTSATSFLGTGCGDSRASLSNVSCFVSLPVSGWTWLPGCWKLLDAPTLSAMLWNTQTLLNCTHTSKLYNIHTHTHMHTHTHTHAHTHIHTHTYTHTHSYSHTLQRSSWPVAWECRNY